ncbi:MAG TPA: glycosyl transferase family 2 [Candidatus Limnocylindria bacterium]|nr:glycosyl transferase family 2 [Candidatus Limnocylindria bacterium]
MRQAADSALDERLRDGVARVGSADLLVGIPSFNNSATVEHVARTVAAGLRTYFPDATPVIVNADGGSKDGTSDVIAASTDGLPTITGAYVGPPGKGSAFRAIFEVALELGVEACAVVDSDLRSITPAWIDRLISPIRGGTADYVTPLYARHKFDGTITNNVAYPLTRALYGLRLRQPIGGEFGFSPELARDFVAGAVFGGPNVWDTDVARFGIDVYMTTTALVRRKRIVQAFLGAKIHDPKDPGADLAPMFTQVVSTAFRLAVANPESWRSGRGSKATEIVGSIDPVEPEAVSASVEILRRKYAAGRTEHQRTWDQILSRPVPGRIDDRTWAGIVYDFLLASKQRPEETQRYVGALVPLYFARVASFIEEAKDLDTEKAEALVERQAVTFEELKKALVDRW